MRKGVSPGMDYVVIFNQADGEAQVQAGLTAAAMLAQNGTAAAVVRLRDRVGAILLAAGRSDRFGENKAALPGGADTHGRAGHGTAYAASGMEAGGGDRL
ncbi:MAG: hypothetical protein ACLRT5_03180 [Lachnospiraceae bacterium]